MTEKYTPSLKFGSILKYFPTVLAVRMYVDSTMHCNKTKNNIVNNIECHSLTILKIFIHTFNNMLIYMKFKTYIFEMK